MNSDVSYNHYVRDFRSDSIQALDLYLFTYLTKNVPLRYNIFSNRESRSRYRQQRIKLQRNKYNHTMNKHKMQFSKNKTNPNQL